MNPWEKEYQQKIITPQEAVDLIQEGDTITVSCGVAGPFLTLRELHRAAERTENVRILSAMADEEYPYLCDHAYEGHFTTDVIFTTGPERKAIAEGLASYLPAHLNRAATSWMDNYPPDIFIGTASPMDEEGNFRLAPCLLLERDAVDRAKTVVLEVSPRIPVSYGDTLVNIKDVDYIIESTEPIRGGNPTPSDPVFDAMGGYIADLIHDGDTLQLGIGGVPNAVSKQLVKKHDIGIHTEMITNAITTLAEAGVITGKKKTLHPGKIIGAFAVGDEALYRFLDGNKDVEFLRASYVIDPRVICQNDNMVSVNTAFCCDVTGQVSSEAIGTRQYSGSGGQVSTVIGANWAKNGRSIIALRSAAKTKAGTFSNIKVTHDPGTIVTLSRNDVDYIVTEYGVAPMRGRSVRERMGNLIAVAHPDYRGELRRDIAKIYGITV